MERNEEELLALVKSWMGRIPMPLDILILDEIGKNISGAGMDTKVVNRSVYGEYNPWPDEPRIERDLRSRSEQLQLRQRRGRRNGGRDPRPAARRKSTGTPTRINSLTASTPAAIRTPIHFPSDRECLERIAPTVGRVDLVGSDLRLDQEFAGAGLL